MVIASNTVPAAITVVDAHAGCKFTAPAPILFSKGDKKRGRQENAVTQLTACCESQVLKGHSFSHAVNS
jgi:hypothetical protein